MYSVFKILFAFSLTISLHASTIEERLVNLDEGWHIIATLENISDTNRLNRANIVWKYTNGTWFFYTTDSYLLEGFKSRYQIINEINASEGIWVYMPSSVSFYIADTNQSDMPMVLVNTADKNFISYFYDINTTVLERFSITTIDTNSTVSIALDSRGYPLEVITDDTIIIFSNYTDTTVGVSLMSRSGVTLGYMTYNLDEEMQEYLGDISSAALARALRNATAVEKAQVASKTLDYSAKTLGFVKHVGETLEKTGKFTSKDAFKYATKTLIIDYLKTKVKEGSVTLEVIDNVHDMLATTAGCTTNASIDCAELVYKTLKHTTDLYEIYQDIKDTNEATQQWITESEALLEIKKAQYLERQLLEEIQRLKHQLDRDPNWYIECGDYSQKDVNGTCVAKTCQADQYGCPSCNMLQELKYNSDGSGVCELIPCAENEKRDDEGFCRAKTCEVDQYDCPSCSEGQELFYYTDGAGYCEEPATCPSNQKVVDNQCVDLNCQDDNVGCSECASGEILVVLDGNGTGYCEKQNFTGLTESYLIPPSEERTTLPTIASCPSGYTSSTSENGSVTCREEDGYNYFNIRSVVRDSQTGKITQDSYSTPVYQNTRWSTISDALITYYPNGLMKQYTIKEAIQNSSGYWTSNTKEIHTWDDNGNRYKSDYYHITLNPNTGTTQASIILSESFYESGRIRIRSFREPYQKTDGFSGAKEYLYEYFHDIDGSPYLHKSTYTLTADEDGVLSKDTRIIKEWHVQYTTFISPKQVSYSIYENGSAHYLNTTSFYINTAGIKEREAVYELVQHTDGDYESFATHGINYFQDGNKETEFTNVIRQDDNGYWKNINTQMIYYNYDGSTTIINYEVIKDEDGVWIKGDIIE